MYQICLLYTSNMLLVVCLNVDFAVLIYQGEGGIAVRNIQKLFGNVQNQQNMVKGFVQIVKEFQSRLQTVSYTHLDVYKRQAIALAVMHDPELLILDEPINGLDPIGIAEVRSFIRELCDARGKDVYKRQIQNPVVNTPTACDIHCPC